jgi:hypothetical protein
MAENREKKLRKKHNKLKATPRGGSEIETEEPERERARESGVKGEIYSRTVFFIQCDKIINSIARNIFSFSPRTGFGFLAAALCRCVLLLWCI